MKFARIVSILSALLCLVSLYSILKKTDYDIVLFEWQTILLIACPLCISAAIVFIERKPSLGNPFGIPIFILLVILSVAMQKASLEMPLNVMMCIIFGSASVGIVVGTLNVGEK